MATDFIGNMTAMGTAYVTMAMNAGATAAQTEPFNYIIAGGLAIGGILLGLSFLMKRKGGKKGRK